MFTITKLAVMMWDELVLRCCLPLDNQLVNNDATAIWLLFNVPMTSLQQSMNSCSPVCIIVVIAIRTARNISSKSVS